MTGVDVIAATVLSLCIGVLIGYRMGANYE
jgi:hypothetical protein